MTIENAESMYQGDFRIVNAGTHFLPMYKLSEQVGWNQTRQDLKLLTLQFPKTSILAVSNDVRQHPIGSGLVIRAGDSLAWIGMILVDKNYRRQGVATSIMRECLLLTRSELKTSIVGLDATPAGLQVYKIFGFKPTFRIWRCVLTLGSSVTDQDLVFEPIRYLEDHLGFLNSCNMDRKVDGLELIQQLYPEGCWAAKNKGQTVGLVMSRPGRLKPLIGPMLANSPETAKSLLDYMEAFWGKHGYKDVFLDIPENHFQTGSIWDKDQCLAAPKGCILHSKIHPSRCLVRMYRLIQDASLDQTQEFIQHEKQALPYLYATGGPELS